MGRRRSSEGDLRENGVTTASHIAAFPAGMKVGRKPWPGKRKKKRKRKGRGSRSIKGDFTIPKESVEDALFGMLDEALPGPGSEVELDEKVGHARKGGKGAIGAWFHFFVGGRAGKKRKGARSSTFRGKGKYAGRKYSLTKLGGGKYRLKRVA